MPNTKLIYPIQPLYEVAPALDMLYLFMMVGNPTNRTASDIHTDMSPLRSQAFCIYPLALAIRATNVYEERSLGIHSEDEGSLKSGIANLRREKGYSKFHLREQLAVCLQA